MTDERYAIADTSQMLSPSLVIFRDLVESNLAEMVRIAGSPARLRPHCKTHKMREVIELELARGITRHKCATIAEAEMLAQAGVRDIFWAYNPVGPNIRRVVRFLEKYPQVKLAVTGDDARPIAMLAEELAAVQPVVDDRLAAPSTERDWPVVDDGAKHGSVEVLLDIDCGQHRTGRPVGPAARLLYQQIARMKGVTPGGLHLYDGHNHQKDVSERRAAVHAIWQSAAKFRDELLADGLPVPRIVAGGTASFPIFAAIDDPAIELSPGTIVFHDWGYGVSFPDLNFSVAALVFTRVISRPADDRVTLDLGYKAVASDPPAGSRVLFPALPGAEAVLQNEEHLVLKTPEASRFQPGDELWGMPRHICPTSALHKEVYVVSGGRLIGTWAVASRDRVLTV
ncbi:MAG: D-TA family PLP-dependent enzyme [Planctomycetaceae bacterium]|nr:D-TA family PLP-dependent enzyme [Planctomycetaceae bacterium]